MSKREVIFKGQQMTLIGLKLKVGDRARDVRVSDRNLSSILPLEHSRGKTRLFMTLPSLDIEICSIALKKFSRLIEDKDNSIIAYGISADLPFAQNRWTVAEGVNNIILLSDYRSMDFARNWGLLMREVGLLASAVYVVDKSGKVTYCEILPEMGREPDYQRAIAAVETAK